jgi:hypothetical protein
MQLRCSSYPGRCLGTTVALRREEASQGSRVITACAASRRQCRISSRAPCYSDSPEIAMVLNAPSGYWISVIMPENWYRLLDDPCRCMTRGSNTGDDTVRAVEITRPTPGTMLSVCVLQLVNHVRLALVHIRTCVMQRMAAPAEVLGRARCLAQRGRMLCSPSRCATADSSRAAIDTRSEACSASRIC